MAEIVQLSSVGVDYKKGVCAICKKKPVERWCDYVTAYRHSTIFYRNPVLFREENRRGAQYETCDLPMCKNCANQMDGDTHLCTHHHELQLQADLPDEYQRKRQQRERYEIAFGALSKEE